MLSLKECKKILNNDLTDEQIIVLRDWMYHMADIAIEVQNDKVQKTTLENLDNKKVI